MNLNLCDDDPPGLLVEPLVVPVRVEEGKVAGEPVVLPHPHRVVDGQPRLLVGSGVTLTRDYFPATSHLFFVNQLFCAQKES